MTGQRGINPKKDGKRKLSVIRQTFVDSKGFSRRVPHLSSIKVEVDGVWSERIDLWVTSEFTPEGLRVTVHARGGYDTASILTAVAVRFACRVFGQDEKEPKLPMKQRSMVRTILHAWKLQVGGQREWSLVIEDARNLADVAKVMSS